MSGGDHGFILTDGIAGFGGGVFVESAPERGQVEVSVHAAELLAGLGHAGGAPAQRHVAGLPVFDVAAVVAGDADH